jgi:hypothetical protein
MLLCQCGDWCAIVLPLESFIQTFLCIPVLLLLFLHLPGYLLQLPLE